MKYAKINTTTKGLEKIRLHFSFDLIEIAIIKKITGREWDKKLKSWFIPLSLENCYWLKENNYDLSPELKKWANRKYKISTTQLKESDFSDLGGALLPFQLKGVERMVQLDGRVLLADEMGLGKTVQALAFLHYLPEARPAVVVCPASVKISWLNHAQEWLKIKGVEVISGMTPYPLKTAALYIINYNILPVWVDLLKETQPKCIIIDEAHNIKNKGNKENPVKRTVETIKLCKDVPNIIAITGTPIDNEVLELYIPCSIINPDIFPSQWEFKMRYCNPKRNGFGWEFKGVTNNGELNTILKKSIMVRRLKKDVLTDLPDKTYCYIPIEIDNKKEYDLAKSNFIDYIHKGVEIEARKLMAQFLSTDFEGVINITDHKLQRLKDEKAESANPMTQIEILKQLSASGKMTAGIEWIENFLASGEKLVVFATHKIIIQALHDRFKKISVKIDGSTPANKRQDIVDSFQNNKKIKLFIGNIEAAGVGITLTIASNVAFFEYPWTPGKLAQAVDRVHRITQVNKVFVHFLIGYQTIDETVVKLLVEKQQIADMVLDGSGGEPLNMMKAIIENFKK